MNIFTIQSHTTDHLGAAAHGNKQISQYILASTVHYGKPPDFYSSAIHSYRTLAGKTGFAI